MPENKKQLIHNLLKAIETGDPEATKVVNEEKYIQHNPQTGDGSEGLAALFKRLSQTSPRVNIVRIFEDKDFVFAHTEYDFDSDNVGFEVFRFEHGQAVEHWDNIQPREGPNRSGHSMVDGPTEATDLDKTDDNRGLVCGFVQEVLIPLHPDRLAEYVNVQAYIEHSPNGADGPQALLDALSMQTATKRYMQLHRALAEGNFVLTLCEGIAHGNHSAIYDLYRVENDRIIEHWETMEAIADPSEWKNDNGKF